MADADRQLPPGPKSSSIYQLIRYSLSPLDFLEECAKRYGDPFTMRHAGYGSYVMLSSPEAIKDVFRGDGQALHSGEGIEFLKPLLGENSVLVTDEEPHARQRRALLPPLKGERMRSYFDVMQRATLEISQGWKPGTTIRTLEPMREITVRVILQVVLGIKTEEHLDRFSNLVRRALELSRGRYGLILAKILPVSLFQRMRSLPFYRRRRDLDIALFRQIDEMRAMPKEERGENVLNDLLNAAHEDGSPFSNQEIRDSLVTLIFAGHDTTAVALAWAFEQIVPNAEVTNKITEELKGVTGGTPPTADQLDQLKYLDATVHEVLRHRTVLPFVVRLTKKPFSAGGRDYPAGIILCPCIHLAHHNEKVYPDPQTFRPERFLERHYGPNEWIPFGGGGRACLGISFAQYEMKVVLSTIFATRKLSRDPKQRSKPLRQGLAIAPDDGAIVTIDV